MADFNFIANKLPGLSVCDRARRQQLHQASSLPPGVDPEVAEYESDQDLHGALLPAGRQACGFSATAMIDGPRVGFHADKAARPFLAIIAATPMRPESK